MGSNNYKYALEQLLIAFDYFKINNNEYLLNTAKYNIANIKKYTDDYAGAKEIYVETTHFFRNHQEKKLRILFPYQLENIKIRS